MEGPDGRIAIVTGSDSGIGRATAVELAAAGADVVVTYRSDESGAAGTCREIEERGRDAIVVQADLSRHDEVDRLFERTEAELGTPYVLVNNAAMPADGTEIADLDPDSWDLQIRTNLGNPFYCCRRFVRARRAAGGRGKIVNVSSVHEEAPRVGGAPYGAAKAGLRNLTRTLALEVASDRINVNDVAPGMILTPINRRAVRDADVRQEAVRRIPWRRAGRPEEVARLIRYLVSDDADYVTGQTFVIDGGLMLYQAQGA